MDINQEQVSKIIELLKRKFPEETKELGINDYLVTQGAPQVEPGQHLDVLGQVDSFIVWACKHGKQVVAILFMAAGAWSTLDFVTPGRFPDAFEIGQIVADATVHPQPESSHPTRLIVYRDDWCAIGSDEQLRHETQNLDPRDPEQLAQLHFVSPSSGVRPEVFENGREITVDAQNFLGLSDGAELA